MARQLTVSLVIPAFNEERYLEASLEAVAAQTVMPDEVIVVDNNSTDHTSAIVRRFPFVKLIHEHRQGLRWTRNTGMDAATGDIIGRIDADTRLTPGWCQELKKLFADRTVHAVTGSCYQYDMPAERAGLYIDRVLRKLAYKAEGPFLYGSNMAMRREVWQRIRPVVCMEGEFFEDCDLSIHLWEKNFKVTYDPRLVVGVSARMLDHSPKNFYQAMKYFDTTFAAHGRHNRTARLGKYIYGGSYPFLKLLRAMYNPSSKKNSPAERGHRMGPRPTSNT